MLSLHFHAVLVAQLPGTCLLQGVLPPTCTAWRLPVHALRQFAASLLTAKFGLSFHDQFSSSTGL